MPSRVITRSISSSSSPVRVGGLGAVDRALAAAGQQVLDVAEREPAVADRAAQLLERVAALAHPRDDPRLRRGGAWSSGPPRTGITFAAAQRFSVDAETPEIRAASLSEIASLGHRADPTDTPGGPCVIRTAPQKTATGSNRPRRLAGFTARFVGRRRRVAPRGPRRSRPSRRRAVERRGPLLACCRLDATDTTPPGRLRQPEFSGSDEGREVRLDHPAVRLGEQPGGRQVEQRDPRLAAAAGPGRARSRSRGSRGPAGSGWRPSDVIRSVELRRPAGIVAEGPAEVAVAARRRRR